MLSYYIVGHELRGFCFLLAAFSVSNRRFYVYISSRGTQLQCWQIVCTLCVMRSVNVRLLVMWLFSCAYTYDIFVLCKLGLTVKTKKKLIDINTFFPTYFFRTKYLTQISFSDTNSSKKNVGYDNSSCCLRKGRVVVIFGYTNGLNM